MTTTPHPDPAPAILATVVNALPVHIALLDERGVIQFVNEAWRRFAAANAGCLERATEGADYLAVCDAATGTDAATAQAFASAIRVALRGEGGEFAQTYPCHSPWQERWFLGRVTPVMLGECRHVVVAHEDITDRRALDRQMHIHSIVTQNMAEGVCLVRASDSRILYVNPRFEQMFGYEPGDLEGQPAAVLNAESAGRSALDVADEIIEQLRERGEAKYEILNIRKDCTTFWCTAHTTEVELNEWGRVWIAVHEDITARKQAEEQLRISEARLVESEMHVATGRMAARLAHEINNPLAGIQNAFLLIKDAVPRTHPHAEFVPRIEREIERIARIVHRMLDLYRPEIEPPHEFLVEELLRDVTGLVEQRWRQRRITIRLAPPPAGLRIHQAEDALSQVLFNLIENAIEVTPDGGEIRVTAAGSEQELQIHITDQGPGIAPEVAARLFEPFATTKESAGGHLGLGLAVSLSLVRLMGGHLMHQTTPNGTTFTVTLPTHSPEREP